MPKASAAPAAAVYQLKITLQHAKPPIWRRVLVPGNWTLARLHKVIQSAMGWCDCHLHEFVIDGQTYGDPSVYDDLPVRSERRVRLETVAPAARRKFKYQYDFGDSWDHEILVEAILPPEPGVAYPVCIAGKRACPPEDVGGVWGYAGFLDALADPDHEEHDSYLAWLGGPFDAEAFDLAAANQKLRSLR